MAQPSDNTLHALKSNHPPASLDQRPTPAPTSPPFQVTQADVIKAIRSFPYSWTDDRDGLRPQHFKDLADHPGGGLLRRGLADFTNLVMSGKVPILVRPIFFGDPIPVPEKAANHLV